MGDFKYIAIRIGRTESDITVYGFYHKRVLLTATSSWMNWGYSVEVMDMSVYKYLDCYKELRNTKEIIDYKGGRR